MTLARLRLKLAEAELDLREMGLDPEKAEILLCIDTDSEDAGDERPLVDVEGRGEMPPAPEGQERVLGYPHILLSDRSLKIEG